MDDIDRYPTVEPLTPTVTTAGATRAAASSQAATGIPPVTPATHAGEPSATRAATSSRSRPGPRLAGVLATSLASATLASVLTVGALTMAGVTGAPSTTAPGATTTVAGATPAPAASGVTITPTDAVVAVAESASPAVVTITTESAGRQGFGPYSLPSTGVGSGFVFSSDGLILTNEHVIEGAGDDAITVTFQDGRELPATVVTTDSQHDLAVIRVEATDLPVLEIGESSALRVGQLVVAIGSPLGTFTESVTSGILSATGRTIDVGSAGSRRTTTMTGLLQTDAAINEGNSGGPLLDAGGRVIGVNVAVATSAQGIGFAVPIDEAASIMAEARSAAGTTS